MPTADDAEDRSAGWHEEREGEGVDEGAEVERVAEMAVGAGGDDGCRRAWRRLGRRRRRVGGAPGAEQGSGQRAEDAEDEQRIVAAVRMLSHACCASEVGSRSQRGARGVGIQVQPIVPRRGEAEE